MVETYILILFRYTKSKFSGKSINAWYDKFKLIAIFLDIFIFIIGIYSTIFLAKKYNINKYYIFLALQIILQIIHDILFYIFFTKYPKNINPLIDEFKNYAKYIGIGAIIGDSYMYLIGVPILFLLTKLNQDKLIFISLICSYLIGYLIYQKPLYKIKTNYFEFFLPLLLNFFFSSSV